MANYWAKHGRKIIGPFPTQQEALDAFEAAHPFKGKAWEANAQKNHVMTGYGTFGPYSNLQWHPRRIDNAARD